MKQARIVHFRNMLEKKKVNFTFYDWVIFEGMIAQNLAELGYVFNDPEPFEDMDLQKLSNLGYPATKVENPIIIDDPNLIVTGHQSYRTAHSHLYYKQMHLRRLFTIDTKGWGPDHSKQIKYTDFENMPKVESQDFCQNLSKEFFHSGFSKAQQPASIENLDLPSNYILVPLQVPTDTMIRTHSPISVIDFVKLISKWAGTQKQNVVLKLHPSSLDNTNLVQATHQCAEENEYIQIMDANIHQLIMKSRGVILINSGTGFESLIHGKPVVTFGSCDYECVTFKAKSENLNDGLKFIKQYSKEQQTSAYQFIYYYAHHHAFSIAKEDLENSKRKLLNYLKVYLQNHVN